MAELIDREATYKVLTSFYHHKTDIQHNALREALNKVPSAERNGRWIYDRLITTTGGTYGVRRCSECESYYQDVGYGFNYCPNCGATMRGE